jgi:hypothetical protein
LLVNMITMLEFELHTKSREPVGSLDEAGSINDPGFLIVRLLAGMYHSFSIHLKI